MDRSLVPSHIQEYMRLTQDQCFVKKSRLLEEPRDCELKPWPRLGYDRCDASASSSSVNMVFPNVIEGCFLGNFGNIWETTKYLKKRIRDVPESMLLRFLRAGDLVCFRTLAKCIVDAKNTGSVHLSTA